MVIELHKRGVGKIEKPIEIGGGVEFVPDGTRYATIAKVEELDEVRKGVKVRWPGGSAWITQGSIINCMSVEEYALFGENFTQSAD